MGVVGDAGDAIAIAGVVHVQAHDTDPDPAVAVEDHVLELQTKTCHSHHVSEDTGIRFVLV